MKSIIIIQLKAIFTKKVTLSLFIFSLFLAVLQALRLRQYFLIYELEGNSLDFLFFTIGGWQSPLSFSFFLAWLLFIIIPLCLSILSSTSIDELSLFILNRIQKRMNLWVANCIVQLLLCSIYFILIAVIHVVVGYLFFNFKWEFSLYSLEFYKDWVESKIPIEQILFSISLIFLSGLYSLFMFMQAFLLLPLSKTSVYISFILITITTSIAYIYADLPKIFSPLFYPSTLSVSANIKALWFALGVNIGILFVSMIGGTILYRKKEFNN